MSEDLRTYDNTKLDLNYSDRKKKQNTYGSIYFFTIVYLILDYGRPQDLIPIGFLRPLMMVSIILMLLIFTNFKYQLFESRQIKLIIAFTILLSIYIPFARNNYLALQTTKQLIIFLTFSLGATLSINTFLRLKKTINILIVLMIYVSSYALTHGGVGSGNYFGDENDVSLYINMWLPFCYFLLFYEKKKF